MSALKPLRNILTTLQRRQSAKQRAPKRSRQFSSNKRASWASARGLLQVEEREGASSRYREPTTKPNASEEVDGDARGRWWERVARSVLTSSLSLSGRLATRSASTKQGCCCYDATLLPTRRCWHRCSNLLVRLPLLKSRRTTALFRNRSLPATVTPWALNLLLVPFP